MKLSKPSNVEITHSFSSARLRTVKFTLWGKGIELTSFQGNNVEVYTLGSDGIATYRGNVRDFARGEELRGILEATWFSEQHSDVALAAWVNSVAGVSL